MRKHKRTKLKKWREYSKNIIMTMIVLWFFVAVFGMTMSVYQLIKIPEYGFSLDGLYNFVGMPMSCGIVGYLIKSAVENKQKIKNNTTPTLESAGEDIAVKNAIGFANDIERG